MRITKNSTHTTIAREVRRRLIAIESILQNWEVLTGGSDIAPEVLEAVRTALEQVEDSCQA